MSISESSAIVTRRSLHRRLFSYNDADPSGSRTESAPDPFPHSQDESDHHPLGNTTHLHDGTVTRPRLARALGSSTEPDMDSRCASDKGKLKDSWPSEEPESGPHRMVIVHEITPTDSLAGVALKYGVSVAELRRANQLWFSDSIHLRKVLYIPLEQSMKHSFRPLIDLLENTDNDDPPSLSIGSKNTAIRRIPASKLSFFPSASSSSPTANSPSSKPTSLPKHPTKHHRYATTDINSTFSSSPLSGLLTSLPIVTRLSFDSTTTSSEDAEQEVELEVVKGRDSSVNDSKDTHHRYHATTPHRRRDDDLPSKYRPPIPSAASFRTAQLAPEPDMHLPLLPKPRSKSLRVKPSHSGSEVLLS